MRFCILSDSYPPDIGGLAISTQRLARGLAAAGHVVHVCVRDRSLAPGRVQRDDEAGPIVHRLGSYKHPRDTLTHWSELAVQVGRRENVDLYHGFFLAYAGFVAAYAARFLSVPSVVSARGNDLDRLIFDAGRATFVLEALRLADAVTVVSRDLAAKVTALVPQAHVRRVVNGVDSDVFAPGPPMSQWVPGPGAALGFVGEARLKKGLPILLDAFALIAESRPVHLVMVGGVREKDRPIVDLFCRQHPHLVLRNVPYLDHARLPGVYNALDLVLLPSLRDGLPNVLLEAMACARPVIATPVGGIVDVVLDGVNGVLVDQANAQQLAQQALALLDDGPRCRSLGASARETVVQAYTPAHELQANLTLYRDLGVL
jgi:glycosyltransferase involved in cell wall biosynthesis